MIRVFFLIVLTNSSILHATLDHIEKIPEDKLAVPFAWIKNIHAQYRSTSLINFNQDFKYNTIRITFPEDLIEDFLQKVLNSPYQDPFREKRKAAVMISRKGLLYIQDPNDNIYRLSPKKNLVKASDIKSEYYKYAFEYNNYFTLDELDKAEKIIPAKTKREKRKRVDDNKNSTSKKPTTQTNRDNLFLNPEQHGPLYPTTSQIIPQTSFNLMYDPHTNTYYILNDDQNIPHANNPYYIPPNDSTYHDDEPNWHLSNENTYLDDQTFIQNQDFNFDTSDLTKGLFDDSNDKNFNDQNFDPDDMLD